MLKLDPMDYRYSFHAKAVIKERQIQKEWISDVLTNPSSIVEIDDNETHCFGTIDAFGKRCLKIVLNPKERMIVTAYFDRNMRKRGCR